MRARQAVEEIHLGQSPPQSRRERAVDRDSLFPSSLSPKGRLFVVFAWILVFESFDLLLHSRLPSLPPAITVLFDALLLVTVLLPVYFFLFRPFRANWEKHKQMAAALQESKEQYRSLVENIDFGIALIDKDFNIVKVNEAQARMQQDHLIDHVGKKCFRALVQNEQPCDSCPGHIALETGQRAVIEEARLKADGSQGYVQIHAFPVFDQEGSVSGFIEVTEDITERKLLERKLVENEERLELALEATNDGLWDYDVKTGEVYFSPRWATMLGYPPAEIEPHFQSWVELLHPDDKDQVIADLNDHLEGHTSLFESEVRMRAKSGDWLWILTRGQAVSRDGHGKPLRVIGTHTNISARKKAEEEIRYLSHQLLKVGEEERARLARDLHDELGQVLAALQFGMETLLNTLPEELATGRSQCEKQIELVALLGDHVRGISSSLRPSILDDMGLEAALEWHIEQFSQLVGEIEVDFQSSCPAFRFPSETEIDLYRICQESLNNITKHSKAKHVSIHLICNMAQIILTIQDDGVGFDANAGNGRGIGLLGMRERAAARGGKLDISSPKGEGTTIRVELPVSEEGTG